MTVLIQQRTDQDCVIACLAMYTGADYGDVLANVNRHGKGGVCLHDAVAYLRKTGFELARRTVWFFESHKAIMDVPSLNAIGGMHAIYWDGKEIFDPQQGRAGKLFWTRELLFAKCSWGGTITEAEIEAEPK